MSKQGHTPPDVEKWMERQQSTARSIDLSVIVPCFNEERRLPPTLIDMIDFLDARGTAYEIIVVDDGSTDHTADVAKKFERIRPTITLIRVPKNYGKGHAVRTGMLNARGTKVLFADADGSTPFREFLRLEQALEKGADVAIGSRALPSTETSISTHWHRLVLGRVFNFCVNIILLPKIADTQCGFKLFTAKAARFLFEHQRSDGFSFDVEVLFLARKAGLKISEVPINWQNVPGSKVSLIVDALKMFRDIMVFKLRHRDVTPTQFQSFQVSNTPDAGSAS